MRSPTGLLLEFPKASLVSAWAAVVDNPAPYEVSRSGGEWMPLEVFLREVKQGSRLTQAFRALPGPGRSSVEGNASPSPGDLARAETGDPSTPASATPPVVRTPTTGFTFKVANTTKPGMSKGMKAILWVLFVSAAGAGGFFLYQYLSK